MYYTTISCQIKITKENHGSNDTGELAVQYIKNSKYQFVNLVQAYGHKTEIII